MTRWHADDPAGRILDQIAETGEQWTVLSLPAIAKEDDQLGRAPGEPLWPDVFPLEWLLQQQALLGKYEWSSLYQQHPVIRGGNMFQGLDAINIHPNGDGFPDTQYVRFWDLASTEKERAKDDPDYTVGSLVGVTYDGLMPHLWIKGVTRCQYEAPQRNRQILATTENDGAAVRIGIESVAGYKDTYSILRDVLHGLRMVEKITVSSDMVVRAGPLEPIFEAGNVHLWAGSWNNVFINEFSECPAGKHDDVVASITGAYEMLRKGKLDILDRRLLGA